MMERKEKLEIALEVLGTRPLNPAMNEVSAIIQAELAALKPKRWPSKTEQYRAVGVRRSEGINCDKSDGPWVGIGIYKANFMESGICISPDHATEAAIEMGRLAGVTLIDRDKVVDWLNKWAASVCDHITDEPNDRPVAMAERDSLLRKIANKLEAGTYG
jgi:hypothetical protein